MKEICPILHHDEIMHYQMEEAEDLSSVSTTTSASHQENMMRLKQKDDFNI